MNEFAYSSRLMSDQLAETSYSANGSRSKWFVYSILPAVEMYDAILVANTSVCYFGTAVEGSPRSSLSSIRAPTLYFRRAQVWLTVLELYSPLD